MGGRGRTQDDIALILSATNRTNGAEAGAPHGSPIDHALWNDWRDAVSLVLRNGSAVDHDPLANGS